VDPKLFFTLLVDFWSYHSIRPDGHKYFITNQSVNSGTRDTDTEKDPDSNYLDGSKRDGYPNLNLSGFGIVEFARANFKAFRLDERAIRRFDERCKDALSSVIQYKDIERTLGNMPSKEIIFAFENGILHSDESYLEEIRRNVNDSMGSMLIIGESRKGLKEKQVKC